MKNKKLFAVFVIAALLCVLFSATVFAAVSGDFTYEINDDGTSVTITAYTDSGRNI